MMKFEGNCLWLFLLLPGTVMMVTTYFNFVDLRSLEETHSADNQLLRMELQALKADHHRYQEGQRQFLSELTALMLKQKTLHEAKLEDLEQELKHYLENLMVEHELDHELQQQELQNNTMLSTKSAASNASLTDNTSSASSMNTVASKTLWRSVAAVVAMWLLMGW